MTPAKRQTVSALLAAGVTLGLPAANAVAALSHAAATPKKKTAAKKTTAKRPAAATTAPAEKRTVVGDTVEMDRWGPVTVSITVQGGKITAAKADLPMERPRSEYINTRVGPYLDALVVQIQSARIDLISGATMTCEAYAQSLQSAMDKAGIKAAA